MTQHSILERGLGARALLVLVIMLVGAAATFAAVGTSHAAAAITFTPVAGSAASVAPFNGASQFGAGAECGFPNVGEAVVDCIGDPAVPLQPDLGDTFRFRVPSVGGGYSIQGSFAGDDPAVGGDIVTIVVTLGGINALAGPATITILSSGPPDGGNPDGAAWVVYAKNVAGTSASTMSSGGFTATVRAVFVGPASVATFTPFVSAIEDGGAVVNPTTIVAGTAAGTGAGKYYLVVRAVDAFNQSVLDGTAVTIQLSAMTGDVTLETFGAVMNGGLMSSPGVSTNEATGGSAVPAATTEADPPPPAEDEGPLPEVVKFGGEFKFGPAANHGFVMFGVKTTAAEPGGFTATVTFLGGAPIVATHTVIATGTATTVTLTPPTAADGANLSAAGVMGGNPSQGWVGNAFDSAGNAVPEISSQLEVVNDTAGSLRLATGTALAAAITAAPGALTDELVPNEIGAPTGTYAIGVAAAAGTAPGTYTFTLRLIQKTVTVDTAVGTVTISGAAVAGVLVDGDGNEVSGNPTVGINGVLTIRIAWTDANDNPVANGNGPGSGMIPAPAVTLGLITRNSPTDDAGVSTHTYLAPTASGSSNFLAQLDAAAVQFTVEIGGPGGGVIDLLTAADSVDLDAAVGDQVQVLVLASSMGDPTENALIRFESNNADPTPVLASTNAAGETSSFVTSNVAGMVIVTATAVTQGIGGVLIPVQGVDTIVFTITFGAGIVQLSDGAAATFTSWRGGDVDSSVFSNIVGLSIIWWWDVGAEDWHVFVPDPNAPDALREVFIVRTFDVLFFVATGEVNVPS